MKRRFRFPLERLKRVRAIEERVARSVWARAESTAAEAEREQTLLRETLDGARADVVRLAGGGTPRGRGVTLRPDEVIVHQRVVDSLLDALRVRQERALTLRSQASSLAAAWRERESDRRVLVELERRQRERHRRELERADGREMDEIASQRSARRRGVPAEIDCEADSSPGLRTAD
ncbi:MAG: hypothetical protein O7B99_02035 [Planctomycetota bacterium]|nr:hypothetical protein [Planctomycetota bacterium]